MADIQLKNLNEITNTSQLTSTKNLLIFDNSTNAGNRISLTTLANSISDQTITGLAGTNQSLKGAINTLNSKVGQMVTSGSLHDITDPGIYYLASGVTDKPVEQTGHGGFYSLSRSTSTGTALNLSGIFVSLYDNSIWSVKCINSTWTYTQMAKQPEVDTLNSNMANIVSFGDKDVISGNTIQDAIETVYTGLTAIPLKLQVGTFGYTGFGRVEMIVHKNSANYGIAFVFGYSLGEIMYQLVSNNGTITVTQMPTRSEVDTLNSKIPSNQNDEVRMKMVMLGAREATFTDGVCVFDLTTVLNASFRSGKTLSHCMIAQAIGTSGAFIVSTQKTADWEITIKAVRNNQQEFSETIGINLMICVY